MYLLQKKKANAYSAIYFNIMHFHKYTILAHHMLTVTRMYSV